jgi:glycosyltransferase involved in cell wall biosynthesis
MKISIVTLSYNQGRFLETAICSVLDQGYPDLDYILVDPGSTDGSRAIIERYRQKLGRVIFEPDDGPADGLNRGFGAAEGEIFGFVNADDLLLPGSLDAVAAAFARAPEADLVYGHGYLIDAAGERIRRMYSDRFSLWGYLHEGVVLVQQSTFFRASAFKEVGGFNPENRSCWDGELWLDLALAGKRFHPVPDFWSGYRVYPGSITGSIAAAGEQRSAYRRDRGRMFEKATGRPPGGLADRGRWLAARVAKWVGNPAALAWRIASLFSARSRRSPI